MLTGPQQISASDWGVITSSQNCPLGTKAITVDGREFRYGLAGASALAVGKLAQQSAVVTNHVVQTVQAAAALGATQVSITIGATAATANQYAGGYLTIQDSVGAGSSYLIAGNAAAASSGTLVVTLAEPLTLALTTASKCSLNAHPYANMIIGQASGTTTVNYITGVPGIAVTAANYGWFQVEGIAAVFVDGTPAAGSGVVVGTTAGAVAIEAAASVTPRLGVVYGSAGVDGKYTSINLAIA